VLSDPATTTIVGPGSKRLTIEGDGTSWVFDIEGGSLALSGLTVTAGRDDIGGGLFYDHGTRSLTNVSLAGNAAIIGGGLYNNGTARLRNVSVTHNAASVGGGITNVGTLSRAHVTVRAIGSRFIDIDGRLTPPTPPPPNPPRPNPPPPNPPPPRPRWA
jgi:hypothetical protein